MNSCAACNNIRAGKIGISGHGMLQFVGQRRTGFIIKRVVAVEEYVCHDCGTWWERNSPANAGSVVWNFVRQTNHNAHASA